MKVWRKNIPSNRRAWAEAWDRQEHGDGHSVGCGDPRATWHQVRLKRHPEPGGTGLSGGR